MVKLRYKSIITLVFGCLFLGGATRVHAQEKRELRFAISYISSAIVFIDGGREQHLAAGDTLTIVRKGKVLGTVAVNAVSNHSCAAQSLSPQAVYMVGDSAVTEKMIPREVKNVAAVADQKTDRGARSDSIIISRGETPARQNAGSPMSTENIVSGRVGIQYSGIVAEDPRFTLNQPSAMLRLDVLNIYGTGMAFSFYSRNYYDISDFYSRDGDPSRLKNRVYEISLQRDLPDGAIGYGVGRMTSRYVGNLGTYDGAHAYVRLNNFTAGVVLGAKVGDRTMAFEGADKKGAAFLNFRSGPDFLHQYDGTIAYGRQMVMDKLDREFIYMQHSLILGSQVSMFESSEIELNDINHGVRTSALSLSSTFFSFNYYPLQWFSANLGYDATRSVYLFETMKLFPDTLFDKNLMQGFRAGTNFRFPYFITLSLNGYYRTKVRDERNSYNVSAMLRMSDIAGSDIGTGLRYAEIVGIYTSGKNLTFDLDHTFFSRLSLSMRYDYYAYSIESVAQSYVTQTVTMNVNYRMTRALYSMLSVDRVLDASMNSYRIYGEIGIRF